jgi:hypothetical protein
MACCGVTRPEAQRDVADERLRADFIGDVIDVECHAAGLAGGRDVGASGSAHARETSRATRSACLIDDPPHSGALPDPSVPSQRMSNIALPESE